MEANLSDSSNINSTLTPCLPYTFDYVFIRGYLMFFTCLFGILGNILVMFILSRPEMRSSPINRILVCLSVADMLMLLAALDVYAFESLCQYYCVGDKYLYWYHHLILPYTCAIGINGKQVAFS
jgi:predicted membrane channel-forming protein YqfA (hemolysin III family)